MRRSVVMLLALTGLAATGWAQRQYSGPRPPKPDVPYLQHADNLIETEVVETRAEERKDETTYIIPGATSPARTPLAEPIFLFQSEKIPPDNLELYRLEVKDGNRQIVFSEKRRRETRPLRLMVTRLAEGLYRIEVNEGMGLENGAYSLSPSNSDQAFCFEEY